MRVSYVVWAAEDATGHESWLARVCAWMAQISSGDKGMSRSFMNFPYIFQKVRAFAFGMPRVMA